LSRLFLSFNSLPPSFYFLTRFFKLSSSVSALTERVTACAIQSIHIIGKIFEKKDDMFEEKIFLFVSFGECAGQI
jgi:hypothetical protein